MKYELPWVFLTRTSAPAKSATTTRWKQWWSYLISDHLVWQGFSRPGLSLNRWTRILQVQY